MPDSGSVSCCPTSARAWRKRRSSAGASGSATTLTSIRPSWRSRPPRPRSRCRSRSPARRRDPRRTRRDSGRRAAADHRRRGRAGRLREPGTVTPPPAGTFSSGTGRPPRHAITGAAARRASRRGQAPAPGSGPTPGLTGVPATARRGPVAVISPLVRKMAREAGLDLAGVTGTGPDGLVRREDVRRTLAERAAAMPRHGAGTTAGRRHHSGHGSRRARSGSRCAAPAERPRRNWPARAARSRRPPYGSTSTPPACSRRDAPSTPTPRGSR